METTNQVNNAKIIVTNVELGYVHALAPYKGETNEAKYSVVILLPKTDTEQVRKVKIAIKAAHEAGQKDKWGGKGPEIASCKHPLRDGDKERPDDEVFKGCYFMTASAKTKPGVIDLYGRDLTEPGREEEVYSGMKANVSITFFAFSTNGNKGIACGLNNIQKVADGPHRGGRVSAAADFAGYIKNPDEAPSGANGGDDDWGNI